MVREPEAREEKRRVARVLAIGGSDSGAGAGVQADLKTAMALGAYATTAITAITAQNTLGVSAVALVEPAIVEAQITAVLEDLGADVVKTGMLGSARIVEAVARGLAATQAPLVIDPVTIAKGGRELLDASGREALVRLLVPKALLVTPNADEAAAFAGFAVEDEDGMARAAEAWLRAGAKAVLVKGGHVDGDVVADVLVDGTGRRRVFRGARIGSRSTHGTGCTLASAIAASIAQGLDLEAAVARGREAVRVAMSPGLDLGRGHAPLDHAAAIRARD